MLLAYSWIEDAIDCVHPSAGDETHFAMLRSYMDESGIQDSAPFCVVAGYVGSVAHWKKFEPAWKKELEKTGIPEFHAKRFFAKDDKTGLRVGDYKGWDDSKANAFLNSLLETIARYKLRALASSVSVPLFLSYSEDERRFLTGGQYWNGKWKRSGAPTKSYYLPFQHCVIEATTHCPVSDKVHYFFDLNKQLSPWAGEMYRDLLLSENLKVRPQLGQISFPTGSDAVGLQAADLICYIVNQVLKTDTLAEGGPKSLLLNRLMSRGGRIYGFTREVIALILKACPVTAASP